MLSTGLRRATFRVCHAMEMRARSRVSTTDRASAHQVESIRLGKSSRYICVAFRARGIESRAAKSESRRNGRANCHEAYRLIAVPPYYANFLIMNGVILLPFYEVEAGNQRAKEAIQTAFPDREVIGIDCSILLTQNGSLHCCTMQYPCSNGEW